MNAALIEQLQQAIQREGDDVPSGWQTLRQWAREWGLSDSHAQRRCRDWVEQGKMEVKTFRVKTLQRLYPVPHYRSTQQ